jgi:hypothetical protein
MRLGTGSNLLLCLIMLCILPVTAHAIPAISCHCFTDRSYDPARPSLADPYFLATTQNSFFAIVFAADKTGVVMKKQQGISSDDLWIAYWVASKAAAAPENLLQDKLRTGAWQSVIAPLRLSPKILSARFSNALNARASAARLSEAVVDELFLKDRLLAERDVSALRKAGASNQELIIAAVIAARMRPPVAQLYQRVKTGADTWGSLLSAAKIDTKNMQQEIESILNIHPRL